MHLIQIYMGDMPQMIRVAASLGGSGVHIFIFCSGFGLYISWLKKPCGYIAFLWKRFKKVYFPYVFIVIISAFLPYMYDADDRVVAVLSHIFLFKMFITDYVSSFGSQLWFISTIFQFYFVFIPLCYLKKWLGGKRSFAVALCVSVIWGIVVALLGVYDVRTWGSFFLQYLWEFVLGMLVADWLWKGKNIEIKYWHLLVAAIVGIGFEGMMAVMGEIAKVFNDIPAFLGYTSLMILIFAVCGSEVKSFFLKIARVSYEWYLVHILVFSTVFVYSPMKGVTGQLLTGFIALVVSYACADGYAKVLAKYAYRLRN